MKGETQARVVTDVLLHMVRLRRFTVRQLADAAGRHHCTVRPVVYVAEELGWLAVDGFGQRTGDQDRGAVPVAYRWVGLEQNAQAQPLPQEVGCSAVLGPNQPERENG